MATVTLEDAPDAFVKQYGNKINFSAFSVTPRKKSFRERMEDPENTASEWMSGDEFLATLKSWTWK